MNQREIERLKEKYTPQWDEVNNAVEQYFGYDKGGYSLRLSQVAVMVTILIERIERLEEEQRVKELL